MNVFSLFLGSFYSAAAYRHMRKTETFGMGYALLLVIVTTLFVTLYYGVILHREFFAPRDGKPPLFDDVVQQIASQVPVMTLHQNELKTAMDEPYTIYVTATIFGESFEDVAVAEIDTSGMASHETMDVPILITNKEVYLKSDRKTEIKPLSDFTAEAPPTLVINQAMIQEMAASFTQYMHEHLGTFYIWLGLFSWFFIAAFMYVARILMLLALGLAGLGIAALLKTPLSYAASVSLASLSFTPVALLDTALFSMFHYTTSSKVIFLAGVVALFAAIRASDTPDPAVKIE